MISIIIGILIGLKYQEKRVWQYSIGAAVFQNCMLYLFNAGGTLWEPEKDGPLTRILRSATQDGPSMGVIGIFIVLITWGVTIYLMYESIRIGKSLKPAKEISSLSQDQNTSQPISKENDQSNEIIQKPDTFENKKENLEQIFKLKSEGILTEEEFQQEKKKILSK